MVAYLLAVDRTERDFVPLEDHSSAGGLNRGLREKYDGITQRAGCQVLPIAD